MNYIYNQPGVTYDTIYPTYNGGVASPQSTVGYGGGVGPPRKWRRNAPALPPLITLPGSATEPFAGHALLAQHWADAVVAIIDARIRQMVESEYDWLLTGAVD